MSRIYAVKFSPDSKYIYTASDDTNIRLWKANASEPIKIVRNLYSTSLSTLSLADLDILSTFFLFCIYLQLSVREKRTLDYQAKLKERYKYTPQIKRIER